jgi:hypothetical protein
MSFFKPGIRKIDGNQIEAGLWKKRIQIEQEVGIDTADRGVVSASGRSVDVVDQGFPDFDADVVGSGIVGPKAKEEVAGATPQVDDDASIGGQRETLGAGFEVLEGKRVDVLSNASRH